MSKPANPSPAGELATAIALHQRGDLAGAERHYREIVAAEPGHADALHLLGVVAFQTGRHDDAVDLIGRAIRHNDSKAEYYSNLSLPLRELGRLEEALTAASRAVALRPGHAESHANRGLVLMAMSRVADAIVSFSHAVELQPKSAAFHNNLGNALRAARRYDDSIASYRRAVAVQPLHAYAWFGLGAAFDETGRREEALAALREAVRLNSNLPDAHGRISAILCVVGLPEESASSIARTLELDPGNLRALKADVAVQNFLEHATPASILDKAKAYSERLNEKAGPIVQHENTAEPGRRLCIGFLCGDLGDHPVGEFTRSMLAHIDRSQLECVAYSTLRPRNPMERVFDAWRYVDRMTDEEAIATIRDDAVDILIDLSGYMVGSRPEILAAKPAPIQVGWLGYSGTTGNARVDYVMVDRHVVPRGEEVLYAERPSRLPDSYLCWGPPAQDAALGPPPALANGFVTFGSFNNLRKVSASAARTWARILDAVPDSRLLLKSSGRVDPVAYERIREVVANEGLDRDRVGFIEKVPDKAEHYAHYNQIDIALDPFPYNGTTTTIEALWMGVPVVTLAGSGFISRVGVSILETLGEPRWIGADRDDYVRIACLLASDLDALATRRKGLRGRLLASPLCDAPRFARSFENALRSMWKVWCASR